MSTPLIYVIDLKSAIGGIRVVGVHASQSLAIAGQFKWLTKSNLSKERR
jgi:hypothetical protein